MLKVCLIFLIYKCYYLLAAKNTFILEKVECFNGTNGITEVQCNIKPVSRGVFSFDVKVNLTKLISEAEARAILYYKYNTYKKHLIDQTFDICAYLGGKPSFPLELFWKNLQNFSNLNDAPCPREGLLWVKADRYEINNIVFDHFMQAGRYRLDFNFTTDQKKTTIFFAEVYFAVSDYRVWH